MKILCYREQKVLFLLHFLVKLHAFDDDVVYIDGEPDDIQQYAEHRNQNKDIYAKARKLDAYGTNNPLRNGQHNKNMFANSPDYYDNPMYESPKKKAFSNNDQQYDPNRNLYSVLGQGKAFNKNRPKHLSSGAHNQQFDKNLQRYPQTNTYHGQAMNYGQNRQFPGLQLAPDQNMEGSGIHGIPPNRPVYYENKAGKSVNFENRPGLKGNFEMPSERLPIPGYNIELKNGTIEIKPGKIVYFETKPKESRNFINRQLNTAAFPSNHFPGNLVNTNKLIDNANMNRWQGYLQGNNVHNAPPNGFPVQTAYNDKHAYSQYSAHDSFQKQNQTEEAKIQNYLNLHRVRNHIPEKQNDLNIQNHNESTELPNPNIQENQLKNQWLGTQNDPNIPVDHNQNQKAQTQNDPNLQEGQKHGAKTQNPNLQKDQNLISQTQNDTNLKKDQNQETEIQNPILQENQNQNPAKQNENPKAQKIKPENPDVNNPETLHPDVNLEAMNPKVNPEAMHPEAVNQEAENQEPNIPPNSKEEVEYQQVGSVEYNLIPGWDEMGLPDMTTLPEKMLLPDTGPTDATFATPASIPSEHLLMVEVKQQMSQFKQGYFSAFCVKLLEMFIEKNPEDALSLLFGLKTVTDEMSAKGELADLGQPAISALNFAMAKLVTSGPTRIQSMLPGAIAMINGKQIDTDVLSLINIVDASYTVKEGDALLTTLTDFKNYPNTNSSTTTISRNMVHAFFQPYYRTAGTPERAQLLTLLNKLLSKKRNLPAKRRGGDSKKFDILNRTKKLFDEWIASKVTERRKTDRKRAINNDFSNQKHHQKTQHQTKKVKKSHAETKMNTIDIINSTRTLDNNRGREKSNKYEKLRDSKMLGAKGNKKKSNLMVSKEIHLKLKQYMVKGLSIEIDKDDTFEKTFSGDDNRKSSKEIKREREGKTRKLRTRQRQYYERLKENEYTYEKTLKDRRLKGKFVDVMPNNTERIKVDIKSKSTLKKVIETKEVTLTTEMYKKRFKIVTSARDNRNFATIKQGLDKSHEKNENEFFIVQQYAKVAYETKDKSKYLAPIMRQRNDYHNCITPTCIHKERIPTRENKEKFDSILKNIREESSYSDEEKQLKTVLSDAIRHSGFVFRNFRNNDPFKTDKDVTDLSTYTDEESILKANIYKVFGYDPN